MNSIEKYKIKDETGIHYKSKICSVAGSIGHKTQFSDLDYRINELTQSFFNQWRFIIETYQRLHYLFSQLNQCSDVPKSGNILSNYDMYSSKHEIDFKDYSYLLIISLKTYFDLFACIVDISLNQKIKKEHQLPNFFNFGKTKIKIPEIILEFDKLTNKNLYPHQLLHKGLT